MENWKVEVKRLDVIRENLGLNFYQLEKITKISRQKISRMFQMANEPSLGFYLEIKSALENQIKVHSKKEKKVSANGCDCKMSGGLFIRGKSGCKKTKEEHKFLEYDK